MPPQMGTMPAKTRVEGAPRSELWSAVDALIDRAPSPEHLAWHGLHLLAIRLWRTQGRHRTRRFLEDEYAAAIGVLSAPVLLERVRDACDGTIVLMKGYEVALLYEDPALRPFGDLDLLVEDSSAAQRALLAAGFVEVGEPELFVDIHHQRAVWLPALPLTIELHHAPKWPDRLRSPPPVDELLASAVPSASNVDGISTLLPAHHALILAAHSWAHLPLRRIQELVDVAVVVEGRDRGEIDALARRWGLDRIWHTTISSADSLFAEGSKTWAERIWARHLQDARERTVLESHLQKWFSEFWALPWYAAFPALASAVADEFTPAEGEGWREKNARIWHAFRNAFLPRSEHDNQLGPGAHRWRRRR
jgi:hypothetical protein